VPCLTARYPAGSALVYHRLTLTNREEFKAGIAKWAKVVKASGAKAE